MIALTDELRDALEASGLPGAAELCEVLPDVYGGSHVTGHIVGLRRLKSRVYRLQTEVSGQVRSLVLKRSDPGPARRALLAARRWLPALGLGDRCPQVLGTAVDPHGEWVWHIYEDLGDSTLDAAKADRHHVAAAVDLIAELHVRSAGHSILSECRQHGGDLGAAYYAANVRDAIHRLELLQPPRIALSPERQAVRDRLLGRLYALRDQQPHRTRLLADHGGPDVLLHGDLWTINTFVASGPRGLRARLIDWDRAGVGPASYDLSTFLYRFPPGERPWILDRYREAVARAGWRLPVARDLNVLFETAECARYANHAISPAVALFERAEWGFAELAEVGRWFEALQPVLPE
ncbi:MAG TPA: aminoglycoside phosphotransferase family protein [Gemmatimonadales bacterium]|nr:aminoglycoside phosphotransferase family protein [Gemmatimonadales bacterium]